MAIKHRFHYVGVGLRKTQVSLSICVGGRKTQVLLYKGVGGCETQVSLYILSLLILSARSSEPTAPLFGKPPKTEQSGSSGTTTFISGTEVPQLFGKTAATQSSTTSTQLFGKPPEEKTEPKPLFSKNTDSSGTVPKPLFGKSMGQTEEPKNLFGKPKDEDSKPTTLFGKPTETGSEPTSLFGKPTETGSESKSLFGKPADTQGERSRSPPASRNLDTGEEERLPRRIRNWGGSRKTTSETSYFL